MRQPLSGRLQEKLRRKKLFKLKLDVLPGRRPMRIVGNRSEMLAHQCVRRRQSPERLANIMRDIPQAAPAEIQALIEHFAAADVRAVGVECAVSDEIDQLLTKPLLAKAT